jgi:hypothetical protein
LRTKNEARAEESLNEILMIDPTHFDTLLLYGSLLLQNKNLEKSEAFLREAVQQKPSAIANAVVVCKLRFFFKVTIS